MGILRQVGAAVGKTAWSLLGGPGGAPFLEKVNLALRFKRKSQFWAQNAHRLGSFSMVKLKVTEKVNPSMSALIMPQVDGFTFSVTLSFTMEKQPTRCAFWGRNCEILLKRTSKLRFRAK